MIIRKFIYHFLLTQFIKKCDTSSNLANIRDFLLQTLKTSLIHVVREVVSYNRFDAENVCKHLQQIFSGLTF